MKKIFYLLLIIFFVFMLYSCVSSDTANSDTVKQNEIYQSYTISYDAGDMELSATAFFRFGGASGTTLNLVKPSNILFNGMEMTLGKNIFSGTFYEANMQTGFSNSYSFLFTDTDNKTYKNSASIDNIDVDEYPKIIKKTEDLKITWKGSPIKQNERVSVSIEGKDFTNCSVTTDNIGDKSILISSELLKEIKNGDANIVLKREKKIDIKEATHLGGSIAITYVAKKVLTKIE